MNYIEEISKLQDNQIIDFTQLDKTQRNLIEVNIFLFLSEMFRNMDKLEIINNHPTEYTSNELKQLIFENCFDKINLNKKDIKEIIKSTYKLLLNAKI